jgi:pimeloyl-ACP methyl ester carboxylesterase
LAHQPKDSVMKPSRPPILLACSRVAFSTLACTLAALALFCVALQTTHAAGARSVPTIVLVHGAFAESSSWDEVIARLQGKGYSVVAADLPSANTALLAAAQRPITEAALNEPSASAAWKRIPSWFIYGTADKNIPPAPQPFMAKRAGARRIVAVDGASHLVMSSQPEAVASLIVEAAEATGD